MAAGPAQARAVSVGWNAAPHAEGDLVAYKQKQAAIMRKLNLEFDRQDAKQKGASK